MSPKLIAYCAAALGAVLLVVGIWKHGHDTGKEKSDANYAKLLEAARQEKDRVEANARSISAAKEAEYLQETRDLRDRITALSNRPNRDGVRLCKPARDNETTIPRTAPSVDAEARGDGQDLRAGEDIERELVQFAGRCEADRKQLIALQDWVNSQAGAWNAEQ